MRLILTAILVTSLAASPALSHPTKAHQRELQARESSGEAASQVQRGGLKRDRRITHHILQSEHRHHYRTHHHANPFFFSSHETGKVLWTHKLPAGGQATPITYEENGRQYVIIMAGGHHFMETSIGGDVAFALPKT